MFVQFIYNGQLLCDDSNPLSSQDIALVSTQEKGSKETLGKAFVRKKESVFELK